VAAGEPAPVALEIHLASCQACRAELRTLRRALAVADAEMAALASVDPSPELVARIRHAAAEAEVGGSALHGRPSSSWRFGWLWPAMAAAATLLVALVVVTARTRSPEPRVARGVVRPQPTARAPVAQPSGEPAVPGVRETNRAEGQSIRRPTGAPRGHKASLPPEPEVLVPPGESEALLRFVSIVHRQRLAPTALAAAGQPSADLAELASIDIKPLEIVPLDQAGTSGT
jgi:hypothetical protein